MSRCYICGRGNSDAGHYHEACLGNVFRTPELPQFDYSLGDLNSLLQEQAFSRISLPGETPMLAFHCKSYRWRVPQSWALLPEPGEFVLDLPTPDFPCLPEARHFYLNFASALGFETAPCALVKLRSKEFALLRRRFDRTTKVRMPRHIEDFCQLEELPSRMQLALCLVTGREWFGHQCPQSRVLLIDNELHKETIACRLAKVATAMGIPLEDETIDNLTVFPQRGMAKDLTLLNAKLAEFKNRRFDVIVIDALYKALPATVDENSNGQITAIYNLLDGYARQMKSAIILVHHTSKGSQANKSVTDVGSGAGAQSRSPDTHLTLRTNEEEGVASVYCCVRSFPPVAPFCLRKSGNNLWELAPDCSPENLDGRASAEPTQLGKMRRTPVEDVADMIVENVHELNLPLSKTLMVEKVREACNTSKDKASAAILYLLNSGYLEERRGDSKSHQQAMKCVYFGPNSPMYEPPVSTKACFRAAQI